MVDKEVLHPFGSWIVIAVQSYKLKGSMDLQPVDINNGECIVF